MPQRVGYEDITRMPLTGLDTPHIIPCEAQAAFETKHLAVTLE
jgi:hypothetical protein